MGMLAERFDCSLEEYHAMSDSWSHSQIEVLIESPPLFHGRFIAKEFPRKESKDFDDGTVAHQALTDINGLAGIIAIIPEDALNAEGHRKGKAWTDWSKEHADKIQMKRSEAYPIICMVANVKDHPKAAWLLDAPGYFEASVKYVDDETGLCLRSRPDKAALLNVGTVLADIKTTRASTPRQFAYDCLDYGYHRQAAWYVDAWEQLGDKVSAFCFISVCKAPPYECIVYEMSQADIELGRQQNRAALRELVHRLETDNWRSPTWGELLTLSLPEKAYRQDQWEIR